MDLITIRRFYDAVADETADSWYGNDILLPAIRDFLAMLPERPDILDLGCGTGHEAKRLAALGAMVTGIDCSSRSIAIARERTPECAFLEMDFFDLDKSTGIYDGIFAAGSLIHLPPPGLQSAVVRAAGVLRKGGLFLAILQIGTEQYIHYPEVYGEPIERIVYRQPEPLIFDCFTGTGLRFLREIPLAGALAKRGWRAYCFQK